ncbi:MAG: phosphate ABC transporter permease PstA [Mycoplasma sp.]
MKQLNLSQKKILTDKIWKYTTFAFSILLALIFIAIIVFIIVSSIPGFEKFGFESIFGTTDFNPDSGQMGVWGPISITLLVTFGAVLLAAPIGIKTATFIKFRLNNKQRKIATIIVQALNGIPSVVFGFFALQSIGMVVTYVIPNSTAYSIINAILMLTFMILPTIITLTLNKYDTISEDFISNPISLGATRTRAIYKVYKAKARNGIIVAVIIAIGRAFGETMALSMILTTNSYDSVLNNGIIDVLNSSLGTLGSLIATMMFSETSDEALRGVLYAFGIFLFVIVMILNATIMFATRDKKRKHPHLMKVENFVGNAVMWVPNNISSVVNGFFIDKSQDVNLNHDADMSNYINKRLTNHRFHRFRTWTWTAGEIICALLTTGFLCWIMLDVFINGAFYVFGNGSTSFQYTVNTTGQALMNTLIIIFVSLVVAIPFALFIAIYLNEYAGNSKIKKGILFFTDCLGSSPSILFGMFGLAVFIELMGLTYGGSAGKSLLAGALTISIVILPTLIRTMQQALEGVPMSVRESAYSLGCTKWETTTRVVLKQAFKPLVSSVIIATGRIMAETAPLYLTAGLTSVSSVGLMMPGQTLTTRIYAQLGSSDLSSQVGIQYECAFIALSIIIILIWLGNYVIPNWGLIKEHLIDRFYMMKNCYTFSVKDKRTIKKLRSQFIKEHKKIPFLNLSHSKCRLYLTKDQAKQFKINHMQFKYFFYENEFYKIKYIKPENLNKLKDKVFVDKYIA